MTTVANQAELRLWGSKVGRCRAGAGVGPAGMFGSAGAAGCGVLCSTPQSRAGLTLGERRVYPKGGCRSAAGAAVGYRHWRHGCGRASHEDRSSTSTCGTMTGRGLGASSPGCWVGRVRERVKSAECQGCGRLVVATGLRRRPARDHGCVTLCCQFSSMVATLLEESDAGRNRMCCCRRVSPAARAAEFLRN